MQKFKFFLKTRHIFFFLIFLKPEQVIKIKCRKKIVSDPTPQHWFTNQSVANILFFAGSAKKRAKGLWLGEGLEDLEDSDLSSEEEEDKNVKK